MHKNQIKVKAMCILTQEGMILVGDGNTVKSDVRPVISGDFYRILDGKKILYPELDYTKFL